jgi:hypothetical protein
MKVKSRVWRPSPQIVGRRPSIIARAKSEITPL